VTPSGGRLWRLRYRLGGVEKLLTLGAYPDVSLKRAREKRDDARKLIADEVDPNAKRQAERAAQGDTFEAIALEWLKLQGTRLAVETMEILGTRLNSYLFPYLGTRPIAAIKAQELLAALRRAEARGRHETAHRVRSLAGRVFRYAVATGRAEHDMEGRRRSGALSFTTGVPFVLQNADTSLSCPTRSNSPPKAVSPPNPVVAVGASPPSGRSVQLMYGSRACANVERCRTT
jgi:Phage integrase central domain/Arm DNA-binding domain